MNWPVSCQAEKPEMPLVAVLSTVGIQVEEIYVDNTSTSMQYGTVEVREVMSLIVTFLS